MEEKFHASSGSPHSLNSSIILTSFFMKVRNEWIFLKRFKCHMSKESIEKTLPCLLQCQKVPISVSLLKDVWTQVTKICNHGLCWDPLKQANWHDNTLERDVHWILQEVAKEDISRETHPIPAAVDYVWAWQCSTVPWSSPNAMASSSILIFPLIYPMVAFWDLQF